MGGSNQLRRRARTADGVADARYCLTTRAAAVKATVVRAPRSGVLLVVVVAVVMAWAAKTHAQSLCLQNCNPKRKNNTCCEIDPAFAAACAPYRQARKDAKTQSQSDVCDCLNSRLCQPGTPGRCTITAGCVARCRAIHAVDEKALLKDAFGGFTRCTSTKKLSPSGLRLAGKACRGCPPDALPLVSGSVPASNAGTPTTTTMTTTTIVVGAQTATTVTTSTVTETTAFPVCEDHGDGCFNACLMRLDSVRSCYDDCKNNCPDFHGGAQFDYALLICQRSCRNGACRTIQQHCTTDGGSQVDPEYNRCCTAAGNCRGSDSDVGSADCEVTTTRTTSSTTTATQGSTTTSTSSSSSTIF